MYEERGDFLAREQQLAYQQTSDRDVAVYLAKVMGWMCLGLFTTVVFALLCLTTPFLFRLVFMTGYGYLGVIVAQLAVVLVLSAAFNKLGSGAATVLFMAYSALTGLTMAVLVLAYELESLLLAFGTTTLIFLCMAVYGFVTKKDLTRLGSLLFFALIGLIISSVLSMFFYNETVDLVICAVGVLIFVGLIAYDTQKIKGFYLGAMDAGMDSEGVVVRKMAIFGALQLYLDFINIFLRLLRLMGRRRN